MKQWINGLYRRWLHDVNSQRVNEWIGAFASYYISIAQEVLRLTSSGF
ncbi:MAG: hypothetical protein ACE5IB_01990 [Candidatus Geothermarchaeales archaeon]